MKCPRCGERLGVRVTRPHSIGTDPVVLRERRCDADHRIATVEVPLALFVDPDSILDLAREREAV